MNQVLSLVGITAQDEPISFPRTREEVLLWFPNNPPLLPSKRSGSAR